MKNKVLVINPGSTSTKLALYLLDGARAWQQEIIHPEQELAAYPTIFAQLEMRLKLVLEVLASKGDSVEDLVTVVGRGGLLPPVAAGAFEVNEAMLAVLEHRPVNHHASNLGAALAFQIAKMAAVKAYIYDPVTVDEMIDLVRITGLKEISRHGQGHNLNMRAAALSLCRENNLVYAKRIIIVAHLGGGITLSLHSKGRIIDMVSDDEGAFSPERAGALPTFKLLRLLADKNLDYPRAMKLLQRNGGLKSHLDTTDAKAVEARAQAGDKEAKLVYEAMALSVARSIAKLSVVVNGAVDDIVLTGGLACSQLFTALVRRRVEFIAPVHILPGENEMQALFAGVMRVLSGEEQAREFQLK
ncbi:MAG: butyrate kinase [Eubacteriales bacterium]|nr:butyrate kinase [Eubacteriales bacterium]MDD4079373.1 butyrate kinase [Eubacteriales bacterium]